MPSCWLRCPKSLRFFEEFGVVLKLFLEARALWFLL
jgi:hypothetical protein